MNERIKELAKQAGPTTIGEINTNLGSVHVINIEKFAELIVGECMSTILEESKWYWDKDEFESSNAIQNAARRVKENFGVEE